MNNTLKHFNANFHVRKLLGNVTVGHMNPIDIIKKQADILKKNAPGEMLTNLICGLNEVFDVSFDKDNGPFVEGGFMGMDENLRDMLEGIRIHVEEWQIKMQDVCEYAEEYPEEVTDRKVYRLLTEFAMSVIERLYNISYGFGQ